jgi:hypothetical protein
MNARPNISDWQHQENRKQLAALVEKGYEFEISGSGYFVRKNGKGIGGANTGKKCHGRYLEANIRDFTQSALIHAQNHENQI